MEPEASTATVSWLPTTYAWSKRFWIAFAAAIAQNEQWGPHGRRGCSCREAAATPDDCNRRDATARATSAGFPSAAVVHQGLRTTRLPMQNTSLHPGHASPAIGEGQGGCACALVCAHMREDADVIRTAGASPVFASCASIASPGSLPRNQKTAGFSRLPSFAGQAGVVEPGLHLRRSARTSDVCRAVLADLELTQVRRVAPVGPARSARRARRSLGSGRLLVCRSRATQPRFGLADRRSSRAGHERRHASSTAATCEATSARACPRSTPDISSVS